MLADWDPIWGDNNKYFFKKVYEKDFSWYVNRLNSIGFNNKSLVLDAGGGFGQWSIALALQNVEVVYIDPDPIRARLVNKISSNLNLDNLIIINDNLENALRVDRNIYDSVFCYSVIYRTEYLQVLSLITKRLASRGQLYLTSNYLGWYFMQILNEKTITKNRDYDSVSWAIGSIVKAFEEFSGNMPKSNHDHIISSTKMREILKNLGFIIRHSGPDGAIDTSSSSPYPESFLGQEVVYEILAELGSG